MKSTSDTERILSGMNTSADQNPVAPAVRRPPSIAGLVQPRGIELVPPPEGPVIFVCCDTSYLHPHAVALARSLDTYSPFSRLHIHVVNPEPDTKRKIDALNLALAYTDITYSWEITDLSNRSSNFRRTYYASVRFARAWQFMESTGADMLILDADTLVRGPLAPLIARLGAYEVALKRRPGKKSSHEFMAGILFVRTTKTGKHFLSKTAQSIARDLSSGDAAWFCDQNALHAAYYNLSLKQRQLVGNIPRKFFDWDFLLGTVLWTGKGPRKDNDEKYLALLTRQLDGS